MEYPSGEKQTMKNKTKNIIWTALVIVALIIGVIIGFVLVATQSTYQSLNQFCKDRQYVSFSSAYIWTFNNTELLSIGCENKDGDYAIGESIPIYNEVFQKLNSEGKFFSSQP